MTAVSKGPDLAGICRETAERIPDSRVDQWEIFAARGVDNDIDIFNGKIETLSFSDSTGIGIRVFKDHSIGYAYTAVLEEDAVKDTIEKAIANSRITRKDQLNYLTELGYQENLQHRTQEDYARRFVNLAQDFLAGKMDDYNFGTDADRYLNGGDGVLL